VNERFDIFSESSEEDALWLESIEELPSAAERREKLAAEKPGKFFLFSCSSNSILTRIETFKKPASAPTVKAAASSGAQGAK
jgi:hypothetical protein